MTFPQPDREIIKERVESLPYTEDDADVVNHTEVNAVMLDLQRQGSKLSAHLEEQITDLTEEYSDELGDKLPKMILENIVARAVRTGAAQVVSELGQATKDIEELEKVFNHTADPES